MSDLNNIFEAVGELRGEMKGMKEEQKRQGKEIANISKTITNHRVKIATWAGGVAIFVIGMKETIKRVFF